MLGGCGRFRGGSEGSSARHLPQGDFVPPGSDIEQALRNTVMKQLQPADGNSVDTPPQDARLVYSRPYYFKEAIVYPRGLENIEVEINPSDSITEPYTAIVRLDKVIFTTDVKRKKQLAEADTNFRRLTGVSTLFYTFKNGRWTNSGSRFEASKTEEYAQGSWVPVREKEVQTFSQGKEQEGILGRIWSSVFGK